MDYLNFSCPNGLELENKIYDKYVHLYINGIDSDSDDDEVIIHTLLSRTTLIFLSSMHEESDYGYVIIILISVLIMTTF